MLWLSYLHINGYESDWGCWRYFNWMYAWIPKYLQRTRFVDLCKLSWILKAISARRVYQTKFLSRVSDLRLYHCDDTRLLWDESSAFVQYLLRLETHVPRCISSILRSFLIKWCDFMQIFTSASSCSKAPTVRATFTFLYSVEKNFNLGKSTFTLFLFMLMQSHRYLHCKLQVAARESLFLWLCCLQAYVYNKQG